MLTSILKLFELHTFRAEGSASGAPETKAQPDVTVRISKPTVTKTLGRFGPGRSFYVKRETIKTEYGFTGHDVGKDILQITKPAYSKDDPTKAVSIYVRRLIPREQLNKETVFNQVRTNNHDPPK